MKKFLYVEYGIGNEQNVPSSTNFDHTIIHYSDGSQEIARGFIDREKRRESIASLWKQKLIIIK